MYIIILVLSLLLVAGCAQVELEKCVSDDDCVADLQWLKNIVKTFSKGCGGVEGRTFTDNTRGPFSHYILNEKGGQYMTCNMAYRRDILVKIGGFDENFTSSVTIGREDSDLAFSVLEKGYEIAFAKNAVVKHPVIRTSFTNRLKKKKDFFLDPLLFKKHPNLYKNKIKFPFELFTPIYILFFILSFIQVYFSLGLLITSLAEIKYRSWSVNFLEFVKFVCLQTVGSFVIVIYYFYGCLKFRVNPIRQIILI